MYCMYAILRYTCTNVLTVHNVARACMHVCLYVMQVMHGCTCVYVMLCAYCMYIIYGMYLVYVMRVCNVCFFLVDVCMCACNVCVRVTYVVYGMYVSMSVMYACRYVWYACVSLCM